MTVRQNDNVPRGIHKINIKNSSLSVRLICESETKPVMVIKYKTLLNIQQISQKGIKAKRTFLFYNNFIQNFIRNIQIP